MTSGSGPLTAVKKRKVTTERKKATATKSVSELLNAYNRDKLSRFIFTLTRKCRELWSKDLPLWWPKLRMYLQIHSEIRPNVPGTEPKDKNKKRKKPQVQVLSLTGHHDDKAAFAKAHNEAKKSSKKMKYQLSPENVMLRLMEDESSDDDDDHDAAAKAADTAAKNAAKLASALEKKASEAAQAASVASILAKVAKAKAISKKKKAENAGVLTGEPPSAASNTKASEDAAEADDAVALAGAKAPKKKTTKTKDAGGDLQAKVAAAKKKADEAALNCTAAVKRAKANKAARMERAQEAALAVAKDPATVSPGGNNANDKGTATEDEASAVDKAAEVVLRPDPTTIVANAENLALEPTATTDATTVAGATAPVAKSGRLASLLGNITGTKRP